MKPITEDQRQKLISLAQIEISRWKVPSDKQYMVELMEIALASLIAEAKYARPFGTDGETLIQCDAEHEEAIPLYAAPPVPVIKLPEYQKLLTHPAVKTRWNECIDEVKRLNGLGE